MAGSMAGSSQGSVGSQAGMEVDVEDEENQDETEQDDDMITNSNADHMPPSAVCLMQKLTGNERRDWLLRMIWTVITMPLTRWTPISEDN